MVLKYAPLGRMYSWVLRPADLREGILAGRDRSSSQELDGGLGVSSAAHGRMTKTVMKVRMPYHHHMPPPPCWLA